MDVTRVDAKKTEKIDQLLTRLDSCGIAEYIKLSERTGKILWLNFLSGVARGLGFTVGTAVVLAVTYKILSHIIKMNIPYLTELLQEFVIMTKGMGS